MRQLLKDSLRPIYQKTGQIKDAKKLRRNLLQNLLFDSINAKVNKNPNIYPSTYKRIMSRVLLLVVMYYYSAFRCLNTASGVLSKIIRSSLGLQFSIYQVSKRISSSKSRSLRPDTCAMPVIPGRIVNTFR